MNADSIFKFIQAPLEHLDDKEKERLCSLIKGKPDPVNQTKKISEKEARLRRIADKKRRLLRTGLFKN